MNFQQQFPAVQTMTITPDIAERLLQSSCGNRSLRQWHVKDLAGAMKRGEWRITSQGIGIDINGHLRDGHHRLAACIKAGVPIRTMVAMGIPADAYEVIDVGVKRNVADLTGEDKRITDVLRYAAELHNTASRLSVAQMRPVFESEVKDAALRLVNYCGTVRKFYSSVPCRLGAVLMMLETGKEAFVLQQYKALITMDFDSLTEASKALMRNVNDIKRLEKPDALCRAMIVFDYERRDVSKIYVRAREGYFSRARNIIGDAVSKSKFKKLAA